MSRLHLFLFECLTLITLSFSQAPYDGILTIGTSEPKVSSETEDPNLHMLSERFPYHERLDASYDLYWKLSGSHIIFEVVVKTNGWVGLGISPNGAMAHSDIVIGWIKDGLAYFGDRHADGNFMPAIDDHQDWHLINASEQGEYTVMKMQRKLETCDDDDLGIFDGTARIIYAYNPSDPMREDSIPYHGPTTRGSKSILLLDPPASETTGDQIPPGTKTIDFLMKNFSVPAVPTYYHCGIFKLPDLGQKHHIIRYSPIIQKGNEKIVHHIVLYFCEGEVHEDLVGKNFNCFSRMRFNASCEHSLHAWAVGGKDFAFPAHVGYPLGTPEDPRYFRLEVHYDNPESRADVMDASGFQLFITDQLREHDAGILVVGASVSRDIIIPPRMPSFKNINYCHEQCLASALEDGNINVTAILLHSHLLGIKMNLRHIREGKELIPLMHDNYYDFDYQEYRSLKKEITIKKGDSLISECVYDSTARSEVTYGGYGTFDEMCLNYLIYYPRKPLSFCLSKPAYKTYDEMDVSTLVQSLDWQDDTNLDRFNQILKEADLSYWCYGMNIMNQKVVSVPTLSEPYVAPPSACSTNGSSPIGNNVVCENGVNGCKDRAGSVVLVSSWTWNVMTLLVFSSWVLK